MCGENMKLAVVDDEKIFREKFCEMIEKYYGDIDLICRQFADGKDIIEAYKNGKSFDAVFLDIEMRELDGLETARKVREFSADVPIIFLTSHTEFAMDGYEVNAFRFLSKSFEKSKIERTLDDLSKKLSQTKRLILKCGGEEIIVSPADVICVESNNNTVNFYVSDNVHSVRMKLSNAVDMLNEASPVFVKTHRCCVVNLSHVKRYSDKEVLLDNSMLLPISKSCLTEFKKQIFEYIKTNAR